MAEQKVKQAPTRTAQWLEALERAGQDQSAAKAVLNTVRDDANATTRDREDFYQALAQQCFVWYLEALRGKPYTPEELQFLVLHEAKKHAEAE